MTTPDGSTRSGTSTSGWRSTTCPVAAFSEVGGLTSDGDVVDYRTGVDIPLTARKLPGQRKHGPVTLKRGVIQDVSLWDWYRGDLDRCQGPPQRQRHPDG